MDVLSKARTTRAWRFCVRFAFAFCLVVFGMSDAVERGLSDHVSLDAALAYAVSADASALAADHSGIHVDGQSGDVDTGGDMISHGCHNCTAIPQRVMQVAAAPGSLDLSPAWASVPSTAGRKPLVDLPPPRA